VTAEALAQVRFRRAIERRTGGVRRTLYAECGSPKYERAAMRWLARYLTEGDPRLQHFAEIVGSLASRNPEAD
jgi:hypothetical protein